MLVYSDLWMVYVVGSRKEVVVVNLVEESGEVIRGIRKKNIMRLIND